MAVRDKSQSVGFVYTNIYQLYKKSKNAQNQAAAPAVTSDQRVWRAEQLEGIKITKFQPRALTPQAPARTPADLPPQAVAPKAGNPFEDLKANLSRLQELHSKLRFMLKELEDLVEKK